EEFMRMQKSLDNLKNAQLRQKNYLFFKTLWKDFDLVIDDNKTNSLYIISERYNIFIKVKHGGYIPSSGFLLIDSLGKFEFNGKSVIDIGCGETGILAHYLFAREASSVVGIDIDPSAIAHAKHSSNVSDYITWIVYDAGNILTNNKFDVIISNPPQMPMSFELRKQLKDWHDSCGDTGIELITQIIKRASTGLRSGGEIFILVFDFLGVRESYNNTLSIEEIGCRYGFSCEIIKSYPKTVRKGGQTEKSISWIKHVYPKYRFGRDTEGNLCYNALTVRFQHS
ncbi:methyltransferase, partial [Patescibacteria group bacterium]|nr:methyltransferase [Patescibacteria group bacterium]MBU4072824.1 methyltransferase [Patescibacteria group bacterium]MCG2697699.1 methyltransferase [Candidatus Parcubacteria bacterium]